MTSQAPVAPAKKSSFAQSYINTNSIVGVRWPCPGSNTMSSGHVHSCLRIIFAVNKYFTSANNLQVEIPPISSEKGNNSERVPNSLHSSIIFFSYLLLIGRVLYSSLT